MLRRTRAPLLALSLVAAAVLATAMPAPAPAQQDSDAPDSAGATGVEGSVVSPTVATKAWILVDADSGAVLAARNHHEPYLVASLVKVMTAFVTLEQLQLGNEIEVSALAAGQPAMRIGMETGQRWQLEHALHAMLMVSSNDAAYAMAEAAGGDLEGFARLMQQTGERLGMTDSTWLDPAGFDGSEGYEGGTRASAYDLAILVRNAMEVPQIAEIVAKPTYAFLGGDGEEHRIVNHNKLLGSFPGVTGFKTGFTRAAGHTFIGTAERGDRRLIAVVIESADHYGATTELLEQGFVTPADAKGTGEVLPAVTVGPTAAPAEEIAEASEIATGSGLGDSLRRFGAVMLLGLLVAFFARREQIKRRKHRRLARRRSYLDARRRGMLEVISGEQYFGAPDAPLGSNHTYDGRSSHVNVVEAHGNGRHSGDGGDGRNGRHGAHDHARDPHAN